MLVVTLGYHTFLAFLINKSKEEPNIEMSITKVKPLEGDHDDDENQFASNQLLERASCMNMVGKIIFIIILILFNVVFWIVALTEHFKSSEDIISSHLKAW